MGRKWHGTYVRRARAYIAATLPAPCWRCGRVLDVDDAWVVTRYAVSAVALRQWVRRGHVKTYPDEQVELFDVLKRVQEG